MLLSPDLPKGRPGALSGAGYLAQHAQRRHYTYSVGVSAAKRA